MELKIVFREPKQYFVNKKIEGECYPRVMTAIEIFNLMDMADCYDVEVDIYKVNDFGEPPTPCVFRGTWHDPSIPLKMVIEDCNGNILDIGSGTDH